MASTTSRSKIKCGASTGAYEIHVGDSYSRNIPSEICKEFPASQYIIITDSNVYAHHGSAFRAAWSSVPNAKFDFYIVSPGESSKSRKVKADIEEWMLSKACLRDCCLIAFGGGVVGDLTGFVAATYMRGVSFVQIPTTMLACVDSSIGGKTGIDSPAGKNLIGAFHAPKRVYVDLAFLRTLPIRELVNGMAEVIKAGAIRSESLFSLLEEKSDEILRQDPVTMNQVIAAAAEIKANVVLEDEKEGGLRAILNFGHSIGHGIEALLQPHYLHGECVAIGMVKEAEVARYMGKCSSATLGRLIRCIKTFGLPTRVPESVESLDVMVKMAVDKKNANGQKRMILLESIGTVYAAVKPNYATCVTDESVVRVIEPKIAVVPSSAATGTLSVPGSKSISNRVLLLAALGAGTCRIKGLLHSDDTQVMIGALQLIGAKFDWEEGGQVLVVTGTSGKFSPSGKEQEFYLSNAGTAYRFLTTCATLIPECTTSLTGNYRMKERPIAPLVEALRANGAKIEYLEKEGFPPLKVSPCGLKCGEISLAGKVSSQYVSSVLISAPYATGGESLILQLEEEQPTSLPYILMTTQLMKKFGIQVTQEGLNRFVVPVGTYQNPPEFLIEVDASSATYPLAMAAMVPGGNVTVKGLGNTSLQGDASFYSLLSRMGCETSQTADCTTVKSPSINHLTAIELNMETMTDAFMTATVVAVMAKGVTKITGIENQRVKECNRIEVMVTELTKLGVNCGELPDGIWIEGVADLKSLRPAAIECHNDHRIAMSFAVLGNAVPDVVILDKECTDKTYPEFWDDCELKLGLSLKSVPHLIGGILNGEPAAPAVFVIGMRGVGKSFLSEASAKILSYKVLDMDAELVAQFGKEIKAYVAEEGWKAFREAEAELLLRLVRNPPSNTIISCGGGVIETPEVLKALSQYPYVVYARRDEESVLASLAETETRPDFSEELVQVWTRRKPLYDAASSLDFMILATAENEWEEAARDFAKFLSFALSRDESLAVQETTCVENSFFLSLTNPDLSQVIDQLPEMVSDVQAIELRVDLLASNESDFILSQIALLRRYCPTHSIVYTVRSEEQGGAFVGNEAKMFELLNLGVRAGCEFVDMECSWSYDAREKLIAKKRNSWIIGSYHAVQYPITLDRIQQLCVDCYHHGKVDIVKIVVKAYESNLAYEIHRVVNELRLPTPTIVLCTTERGALSRVLNSVLTPVTHPLLPAAAAPGQLSAKEIVALRSQLGLCRGKKFFLFGSPIEHSPSPAMHNAAFKAYNYSHQYSLCETTDVGEIKKLLLNEDFGGGSVTIPLKLDVCDVVDSLSDAARSIGAVNTIYKDSRSGKWVGGNTDWMGIMNPIKRRLGDKQCPKALVIGAGGTAMAACYAMKHLGADTFVYNRTAEKATAVAKQFGATALSFLEGLDIKFDIVIGTIPASAEFTLPAYLLHADLIVLDAAYKPAITALLSQASSNGCRCIQGAEMLVAQGLEQFKIWTNRSVPSKIMSEACHATIPAKDIL